MKFLQLITITIVIIFTGCSKSNVTYNSKIDKNNNLQYYENEQCSYYIGPFNTEKELNIEELIKSSIKEANKDGLYGNQLINIKVQKAGYTTILFTKYCLYIQGNLIYVREI